MGCPRPGLPGCALAPSLPAVLLPFSLAPGFVVGTHEPPGAEHPCRPTKPRHPARPPRLTHARLCFQSPPGRRASHSALPGQETDQGTQYAHQSECAAGPRVPPSMELAQVPTAHTGMGTVTGAATPPGVKAAIPAPSREK